MCDVCAPKIVFLVTHILEGSGTYMNTLKTHISSYEK